MLADSGRLCDACGVAIADGQKYHRRRVASLAEALGSAKSATGAEPTFVIDDDGSVTMELCQTCGSEPKPGSTLVS